VPVSDPGPPDAGGPGRPDRSEGDSPQSHHTAAAVPEAGPGEVTAHLAEGGADRQVLKDLREARRDRRTTNFDFGEAFYKAYLTGVLGGVAVWLLSGVVGDTKVDAATAARVTAHGPPVIGMVIGVILAIGLRSGGRGGPLVIEAADVRHVLLSPIDRTVALRGPAIRQLRFGAAAGTVVGIIAGLLAWRRLPGEIVAWLACGAATTILTVLAGYGLALIASGRRFGSRWGSLAALVVAGWSLADLLTRSTTSPATFLGEVALWPLKFRVEGLIGPVVCLVVVVAGLAVVGGTSIEASERRATLVGQMRFAATLRDLRTVVVLRRQLAQELPRQKPWLRMPRALVVPAGTGAPGAGAPGRSHPRRRLFPVWRRGWHGILRFPGLRFARLAVAGGVAGAALVGAVRGTTPLLFVAAAALYIAGLDAVEPMAQELDHPDRTDSYAIEQGVLLLKAAGPSIVLMLLTGAVGVLVAFVITGGNTTAWSVGVTLLVPAALCTVAGASMSVIQGPPPTFSSTDSMLPPEMAGARAAIRTLLPPLVTVVGVLPVLAARHPPAGVQPAAAVAVYAPLVVLLAILVGVWIRYRARIAAWWKEAMAEAKGQGNGLRSAAAQGPASGPAPRSASRPGSGSASRPGSRPASQRPTGRE
jgi:hypothetical protein